MGAVARFLWFPTVVVLVTLAWLRLDSVTGWKGVHLPWLGALLLLAGIVLASWCSVLFLRVGKGTPNPFTAKTKRLVASGPYACVRNPMMWGIGAVLAGVALLLGSAGLWFGFAMFLLFARWFVPAWEEPDMERRFGEEYREYCRQVPRWWPKVRKRSPVERRRFSP